jgi:hypothetical protein
MSTEEHENMPKRIASASQLVEALRYTPTRPFKRDGDRVTVESPENEMFIRFTFYTNHYDFQRPMVEISFFSDGAFKFSLLSKSLQFRKLHRVLNWLNADLEYISVKL